MKAPGLARAGARGQGSSADLFIVNSGAIAIALHSTVRATGNIARKKRGGLERACSAMLTSLYFFLPFFFFYFFFFVRAALLSERLEEASRALSPLLKNIGSFLFTPSSRDGGDLTFCSSERERKFNLKWT